VTERPASSPALTMTRVLDAPRADVFRAWTDPESLREWWGPGDFTCPSAEVDLRRGGRYRLVMQPPGGPEIVVAGVYQEVDPPSRLVYTWSWEGGPATSEPDSVVTVEFRDLGNRTEVVVSHGGFPPGHSISDYESGWAAGFVKVEAHLRRTSRA